MKTIESTITGHQVVSREEWLAARKELLQKEKEYMILDMVPKGRDEDQLTFTMEWVRHHDRYGTDEFADADKPYWPATASPS